MMTITNRKIQSNNLSESVQLHWVTRAEYQQYIDDMQTRGIHAQPDHWESSQYAHGTEHLPVVGIRSSDAIQFCRWLNTHSGYKWHYRLPMLHEIPPSPNTSIGYWCQLGKNTYRLVDVTRSRSSQLQADRLAWYFAKDLDLALMLARARERNLAMSLSRQVDLALHRACVRPIALEIQLEHIHARIQAKRLAQTLRRARLLMIPQEQDLMNAFDLDRDLARALDKVASREGSLHAMRENTRSVVVTILDFLYGVRPIEKVHIASNAERDRINRLINEYLDLYIDLVTLEERFVGNIEPFEGLQIIRESRPSTLSQVRKLWHQPFKRATV